MSTESVMPSNHLILCHPLVLPPSIFPSIRVFSNESALRIRWPKYYWTFSFNISLSNEHSGLISFRMDWLDLHAVQGTLKSPSPTPQFNSYSSSPPSFHRLGNGGRAGDFTAATGPGSEEHGVGRQVSTWQACWTTQLGERLPRVLAACGLCDIVGA